MDRSAQIKFPIPEEELALPGTYGLPRLWSRAGDEICIEGVGSEDHHCDSALVRRGRLVRDFLFLHSRFPVLRIPFESTAITASGIRAALDVMGKEDINVLAWAGDGGTFDIGLQALSGSAERNDDIIYVCYDNEGYMNTGIQRSSSTPAGAWTTTTPAPLS